MCVAMNWNLHKSQNIDPLNKIGKRNIRNTFKSSYNCGGYALGTYSWYLPRKNPEFISFQQYAFLTKKETKEVTQQAVECMLEEFPTLRVVNSLDEVKPTEYAILFRFSPDGDFHFLRRGRDNHWRHKMGSSYYINTIKTKDIFEPWCNGCYNGPIVIMAKEW